MYNKKGTTIFVVPFCILFYYRTIIKNRVRVAIIISAFNTVKTIPQTLIFLISLLIETALLTTPAMFNATVSMPISIASGNSSIAPITVAQPLSPPNSANAAEI